MNRTLLVCFAVGLLVAGCQDSAQAPAGVTGEEGPVGYNYDELIEDLVPALKTHWIAEDPVAADAPPVAPEMLPQRFAQLPAEFGTGVGIFDPVAQFGEKYPCGPLAGRRILVVRPENVVLPLHPIPDRGPSDFDGLIE